MIPNAGGRSKNDRNGEGGRGRGEEDEQQQATAGKRVGGGASGSEPRRFEGRVGGDRWIYRMSAGSLTGCYVEGASPPCRSSRGLPGDTRPRDFILIIIAFYSKVGPHWDKWAPPHLKLESSILRYGYEQN